MSTIEEKTEQEFEEWKSSNLSIVHGEIKVMRLTMSGTRNLGVSLNTFEDCFKAAALPLHKKIEELDGKLSCMDMLHDQSQTVIERRNEQVGLRDARIIELEFQLSRKDAVIEELRVALDYLTVNIKQAFEMKLPPHINTYERAFIYRCEFLDLDKQELEEMG